MEEGVLERQVCEAAQQLWLRGLLVGADGLISVELHRRRYLVTPPGIRRSALRSADLATVDIGGTSMSGGPPLEAARWLPHRLAYQRRADLAGPDGRPARVRATVLACPPMTMALLRRRAEALTLMLAGLAPIAVVEGLDEPALRQALETHEHIVVRTAGLLCIGADLASVLNQVETVEHAATVELASERGT